MSISDIFKRINDKKDDKELVHAVNEIFENAQTDYSRAMLERIWYRNVLYYMGEQWIEFLKTQQTFRRKIIPDYIPTPVTNIIREHVRTVKAMLLGVDLKSSIAPNTMEREDIKAAELGVNLLDWMDNANDGEFLDEKEKVATGLPLFGVNFLRTFPEMQSEKWIFDKDGNPINTGDVGVENIIPFQVYCDSLGDRLNKKRWVGIQSLKPREWVEDTFKLKLSTPSDNKATDYYRRLMKMVGQVSPWKGAGIDSATYSVDDDSLILFREVEMKPTLKYPEGRYILACSDKIIKQYDRMPIKVQDGKWYYSLTDFHYDYIPGNFWSDASVNNLISPQNTINEIDQALIINRKGAGRVRLFTPTGLKVKKVDDVGGLGVGMQVLEYDALLSGGAKPSIEQGTALPQSVLEERAIQRSAVQDIEGDPKNILRGQSPGSKASGIMVDVLRETAERSKAPDVNRFIRSLTKVQKKKLIIAQEIMTEERMLKICGRGNKWKIVKFKASDLRNNTDLRMEVSSGLATTNSGKMSVLMDFAQRGLLGDVANNPELKDELLKRAGLSGFTKQENVDSKRADMENAKIAVKDFEGIFLAEPNPESGAIDAESEVVGEDPYFKYDVHQIHYETHRQFMLSDEFAELPQEAQVVLIHHADAHHHQVVAEEANKVDPSRDPREFLQLDKLIPVLSASERMQVMQKYLGIEPDQNPRVVGVVTADEVFKAQQEKDKTMLEGVLENNNQKREKNATSPR
jgi:hypothetical protein